MFAKIDEKKPVDYITLFGNPDNKMDKTKRYGWSILDEPGKYVLLPKSKLKIDRTYQREQRRERVSEISKEWSWVSCGAISVTLRDDGNYYILDGGHRKMAADLRSDINVLPCIVFKSAGVEKESDNFLRINSFRASMHAHEKFKAKLIRGDEDATALTELMEETGYSFSAFSGPWSVCFINTLVNSYNRNREGTIKLWPIYAEICGENTNGTVWSGLFYIHVVKKIDVYPYIAKLKDAGTSKIYQEILKARAFLGVGGEKTYAAGVLNVINYRLRNKIEL